MGLFKVDRLVAFNYVLPLLIVLISIILGLSPLLKQQPELATAITYDLVLTAPVLFFMLSFKSKVAKLKTLPFFIGGIVIATFLLPESGQEHLGYIKTYFLPFIEIIVLAFLSFKIYKGVQVYKAHSNQTADFLTISKRSATALFGKSRYASVFASEISMLYYAFFSWKPKKLKKNEFTKYKENASIALAGAFLMVICIETYAFHVLLMKWSAIAAWTLTLLSIYSAFSIVAHMKALLKRPSFLTHQKLILRNGLLADIVIPLTEIDKIEVFSKELHSKNLKIGNLGFNKESSNHNIAIHFTTPQTIEKMYGFIEECDILLVHIDEKNRFVTAVQKKLNTLQN